MATDVPRAFESYATEEIPQAPAGAPGKDGRLDLEFAQCNGETRLVRDFARAPFHISGTLDSDPLSEAATVYSQSPTGGIAQGDRHDITVAVGADAVAHVSTQSATKVYSMDHNYAHADVSLSVGSGGHLDYVPEPTILHERSRLYQSLTLDVAADGSAVVGEIVVPGRLAREEVFEFERYLSRVRIRGPDRLLATDAAHLQPGDRSPQSPGVLGGDNVYGTLFVVAPAADETTLSDDVHEAVAEHTPTAGATALPNGAGVVVRALGETSEPVRETLHAAWSRARNSLIGAPAPERRK